MQYRDKCSFLKVTNVIMWFLFCRHGFPIKCTDVVLADDNETVVEIHAEYDPEKKTIPKKVLLTTLDINDSLPS